MELNWYAAEGLCACLFATTIWLDFSLTLPPGLRFERYLIKQAIIQAFPELAKVPYTGTGYPLMPCSVIPSCA
jgi:hypothetical protein